MLFWIYSVFVHLFCEVAGSLYAQATWINALCDIGCFFKLSIIFQAVVLQSSYLNVLCTCIHKLQTSQQWQPVIILHTQSQQTCYNDSLIKSSDHWLWGNRVWWCTCVTTTTTTKHLFECKLWVVRCSCTCCHIHSTLWTVSASL